MPEMPPLPVVLPVMGALACFFFLVERLRDRLRLKREREAWRARMAQSQALQERRALDAMARRISRPDGGMAS